MLTRRVLLAAGLAPALLLTFVPEADAGVVICGAAPGKGDIKVREVDSIYVGGGIYACNDDEGQTIDAARAPGEKFKFEIKMKNDSNKTRHVYVAAVEDDEVVGTNPDFTVKFTANGKNVTDAVMFTSIDDKPGKRFKNIPAGASAPTVKGTVTVKESAVAQDYALRLPGFLLKPGSEFEPDVKSDVAYVIVQVDTT